jgi:DNA polymerase II small subunit/DNA polymerase delta subunit B
MEKHEILKEFLDKGCQLDTETLDYFHQNQSNLNIFLNKNIQLPPIIDLNFVSNYLKKQPIKINNRREEIPPKISTDFFVQFLNKRYETIKNFLVNRLELVNLISINKITSNTNKFSLIVMIKEKDELTKSLTVEDQTGEVQVLLNKIDQETFKKIVFDEVIGINCEKNERIEVTSVIWPDIPLKRDLIKAEKDVFCLFISDMHLDDQNFNEQNYEKFIKWFDESSYEKMYIFVLGNISQNIHQTRDFLGKLSKHPTFYVKSDSETVPEFSGTVLEDNSNITIENGINLLLSTGKTIHLYEHLWPGMMPEQVMLNLLKKRHLNPVIENIQESIKSENQFLIDPVPDIFVSGSLHKSGLLNYKGTTILSNSDFVTEPMFWLVNLRTRETIKLSFT